MNKIEILKPTPPFTIDARTDKGRDYDLREFIHEKLFTR